MSVAEMKKQIIEKVETLNEQELVQLQDILDSKILKKKEYNLLQHYDAIVAEREEVLRKLAQ